jgi:hypothetical protein
MQTNRIVLFVLTFAAACSGGELSDVDQPDSGSTTDSGLDKPDSGSPDSGSPADTGSPGDTGSPNDTGTANDGGTAIDGGTDSDGGENDGGVPAMGACTNPADEAVHMNSDVPAGVETCASGCFGAPSCTRDCIIADVGLSMECTECYVDIIRCTIQNCIGECSGSDSAACQQCRDDNGCTAEFEMCSGRSAGN